MKRTDSCLEIEDWQRYVLDPEAQGQEANRLHLEICPYCRFLVDQARRELEELERVWEDALHGVIPLREHPAYVPTEEPSLTTLAAKGNDEAGETASVTLSSEDQKLLLHAIRDPHSKEIWLYLKADDPSTCRNVLVRPFGTERELLTDDDGRINLGGIKWPKPEELTAEVRLPRATFRLSKVDELSDQGSSSILESPAGDRIRVSFTGQGRNRKLTVQVLQMAQSTKGSPLKVAIRIADSGHVSDIQSITLAEASFDNVSTEGTLEIYLFQ